MIVRSISRWLAAAALGGVLACQSTHVHNPFDVPPPLPAGAETRSLLGSVLFPPPLEDVERAKREAQLAEARDEFAAHRLDAERMLWVGRRLAYLGRFREAIDVYVQGQARFPTDPRFLRHCGHRHITLREFDSAETELARAVELEAGLPDEVERSGLEEAGAEPLSTRDQETNYHLALVRTFKGDFEGALPVWQRTLRLSTNPDSVCSATTWLYATLRRLGRAEEARAVLEPITADMGVTEYHAYHKLLLAYKGVLDPETLWSETIAKDPRSVDAATIGYGLANWHLCEGRAGRAEQLWRAVLTNPNWHAFGFIGSEVEIARRGAAKAR